MQSSSQILYNSSIAIEILSVRGIEIENHTYLRNIKVHVIFEDECIESTELDFTLGKEISIDFSSSFRIKSNTLEVKQVGRPIYIYLSQSLSHNVESSMASIDHQPVGITFSRTLLSQAVIDSRLAFLHSNEYLSVELVPCNCGGIIDVGFCGVLFLRMSILGPLSTWLDNINEENVKADIEAMKINIEKNQKYIERLNYEQYQSIKSWYANCRSNHPYIEDRRIKLISLDECGRHRMVCNFVGVLKPPRSMDGPRFAARFVSLIPFYRSLELIGGNISSWNSSYSTLVKLQGDIEDHAIVLCSLLLGWGMDAWIAYGSIFSPSLSTASGSNTTKGNDDDALPSSHFHYWVVTLDGLKHNSKINESNKSKTKLGVQSDLYVTFWEPLTGQQYNIPCNNKSHYHTVIRRSHKKVVNSDGTINDLSIGNQRYPFRYIYTLFRHDNYLINLQQSPNVSDDVDNSTPMASFDVSNERFWSRLQNPHYQELKHPGASIPMPYHVDASISTEVASNDKLIQHKSVHTMVYRKVVSFQDVEVSIENAIKQECIGMRANVGLQTSFDDLLSLTLQVIV